MVIDNMSGLQEIISKSQAAINGDVFVFIVALFNLLLDILILAAYINYV